MSTVAIIPARGGSKGIPRKNLQPIEGIPLIGWTVRAALAAESIDAVYVSTEDAEIAAVSREYGARVIDRPAHLAQDQTVTAPVVHHALSAIPGGAEIAVTLECTSPLMEPGDIDACVKKLRGSNADVVTTVSPDHAFQLRLNDRQELEWITHQTLARRQDLPPTFHRAGGVLAQWADVFQWLNGGNFYGRIMVIVVPEWRSIDIDSPADLYLARAAMAGRREWIVAGASPSAPESFARARLAAPFARSITTNDGHLLFNGEAPDVYHIHDWYSCKIHQDHARGLRGRGTRLTTLARRDPKSLKDRNVDWFDEFLDVDAGEYPGTFQYGRYASCGFSGLICLQYALNHGATRVHLVGMEGYGDGEQHFCGDRLHQQAMTNKSNTGRIIGPFTQSCIDACPGVDFVFYGKLNYQVSGSNVICVS